MASAFSFKAIVNLSNAPEEVEHLKRLALIFDEIYYLHPQVYCFDDMSLIDPSGKFQVDFFRDCEPYNVISLNNLQETIDILEEAKIAKGIVETDGVLIDLRRDIALIDQADPVFRKLTPNSPAEIKRFTVTYLNGRETGRQADLVGIVPSVTIWDSLILTNTLYLANKHSLIPVFLEPRHRREMEYRYNQYRQQSSQLAEAYPDLVSPVSFGTQFGEVTFSIFNNVWSHELLINRSPEDILRYRDNMASARQKYIASLTELANLAETNPWNQKTKDEVNKYLLKLEADSVTYRQAADGIRKKMFDDLRVHATDVAVKGIAGGLTGGGLSGVLAQDISSWVLVLAGVLMGSSKTIPKAVQTILDSRRAQEEHKNNSIAYIAEFK